MSSRRKARELALKVLYQKDTTGGDWKETFEYLTDFMGIDEEGQKFAKKLTEGTLKNLELIDSKISKFSQHWKLSRISIVDRNILRLACYEMLFEDKIPYPVSIDEAIELGKKYSTEESKSFINGVLDGIRKSLKKEKQ
jgi:N utilization substance protein B